MLRLGLVFRGLMVNMRISNAKLRLRAHAMVAEIAGEDEAAAATALDAAGGDIRRAILHALGLSAEQAEARLAASRDFHDVLRGLTD